MNNRNKKDVTEKQLIVYNDVFADIINSCCFHGKQVVKPAELEDAARMLADGMSNKKIMKYSRLSREDIESLRRKAAMQMK